MRYRLGGPLGQAVWRMEGAFPIQPNEAKGFKKQLFKDRLAGLKDMAVADVLEGGGPLPPHQRSGGGGSSSKGGGGGGGGGSNQGGEAMQIVEFVMPPEAMLYEQHHCMSSYRGSSTKRMVVRDSSSSGGGGGGGSSKDYLMDTAHAYHGVSQQEEIDERGEVHYDMQVRT